MPSAEIIAIGTELLLGEIQDSNTRYLARKLRNINVDLYRSTIIGDNINRISDSIREALTRADIVITSGGLGPTVDDPTRQAVATAFGAELMFVPELWEQINQRFIHYGRTPSENNRRQAFIPNNAHPITNPVGTAPAFLVEKDQKCVISLPGVPHELEYLMENEVLPYLISHYQLSGIIKVCVIHTAGIGESLVDESVADLELLSNPTVGLLAHPGQTDIRITVKAQTNLEADDLIADLRKNIETRLGKHIFGVDDDTLESIVIQMLDKQHLFLTIFEHGLSPYLSDRLQIQGTPQILINSFPNVEKEEFILKINDCKPVNDQILLGIFLNSETQWSKVTMVLKGPQYEDETDRSYGGPPLNSPQWAASTALDYLRRHLYQNMSGTD